MTTTTAHVGADDYDGDDDPAVAAAHRFWGEAIQDETVVRLRTTLRRNRTKLESCQAAETAATETARRARARSLAVRYEFDPDDRHRVPRSVAFGGAVAAASLDFFPSYMAAQSFDLDGTETDLIAALIVITLAGAMMLLNSGTRRQSHRRVLQVGVGLGFGLLYALRVSYLVVTGISTVPVALLASAALTGISAALVVFGAVLLSRRMPAEVAAAEAEAVETEAAAERAMVSLTEAQEAAERSRQALYDRITAQALANQPSDVDPGRFMAAVLNLYDLYGEGI